MSKPFIKWVGGKGQLLGQLAEYYPTELNNGAIERYVEPFLGGGAMFFALSEQKRIKNAYLSDTNRDLVLTYLVVQQRPHELIEFLEQYQQEYNKTAENRRSALFLSVREHFNSQRFEINYRRLSDGWIARAAQFIFLNKTCFNGLFRLNSKGEFNVPFGKYGSPTILDEANIIGASQALQRAEVAYANYMDCHNVVDGNSFVYFDPPYRPLSATSSFTTYTGERFRDEEQIELSDFYRKLDFEKGAKLMLSNSDPADDFFERAYSGYNMFRVSASRSVNCNGNGRGKVSELLIINYNYEPRSLAFDF